MRRKFPGTGSSLGAHQVKECQDCIINFSADDYHAASHLAIDNDYPNNSLPIDYETTSVSSLRNLPKAEVGREISHARPMQVGTSLLITQADPDQIIVYCQCYFKMVLEGPSE